jgi:hypothetical protein
MATNTRSVSMTLDHHSFRSAALVVTALLAAAAPGLAQQQAQNLVYTAVAPCRVADTRLAVAGALVAGVTRTFHVVGATNDFGAQGGTVGGCGLPGYLAGQPRITAVMFNFVAVGAVGDGHLTAWGFGAAPLSSVINYTSATTVANGVVVPVDQDATEGADLRVLAAVSSTHVVIDVLGYFSPLALTDGAGSSLDADTLDGLDSSAFTVDSDVMPLVLAADGPGSTLNADLLDGLDSTAFQRRYAKVATVALSGTGDYADPVAAMSDLASWCGTPSFNTRCLLRIMPGIYVLSQALTTADYVDVEGTGQSTTVLWRSGSSDTNAATVVAAGSADLRDLAIVSNGGEHALGMLIPAGRIVRNVYVSAQGSTSTATAVRITGSIPRIEGSFLITFGPAPVAKALEVTGGSSYVRRTDLVPGSSNTAECTGVHVIGTSVWLEDVRIFANIGCANNVALRSTGSGGNRTVRRSRVIATNATTSNVVVQVDAGATGTHTIYDSDLGAGAAGAIALDNASGSANVQVVRSQLSAGVTGIATSGSSTTRVQHSTVSGTTQATDTEVGSTLQVGASQLTGTVAGAGAHKCVGAYDSAFDPLQDDCQP